MSTLLLRLAAPLQSWGVASKFDTRLTDAFPSKSGVVGMLACALGRNREDSIEDLSSLRFGIRVDQPGERIVDFQMVHKNFENKNASMWVTRRHYLADAVFLVGLEGDGEFLDRIAEAIKNPVFPIYLGRRSCPPAGQMIIGRVEADLKTALSKASWQAGKWYQDKILKRNEPKNKLEIILDAEIGEENFFTLKDMPVSFDQRQRIYSFRDVVRIYVDLQQKSGRPVDLTDNSEATEHDPMTLLEV